MDNNFFPSTNNTVGLVDIPKYSLKDRNFFVAHPVSFVSTKAYKYDPKYRVTTV